MKKTLIFCIIVAGIYACGTNGNETAKAENANQTDTKDITQDPAYAPGLELIAKSGCLTCHKLNEASAGPSYASVAAKYPNTPEMINTLAGKIIKGGSGNWGAVPMTPHPAVSVEEAKAMVRYIMLQKK